MQDRPVEFGWIKNKPDARDKIIDQIRLGKITPAEGEREARDRGLQPLQAPAPDPADFDPMTERWWTIPMAIGWIISRSAQEVRRFWDDYRRHLTYWREIVWPNPAGTMVHRGLNLFGVGSATLASIHTTALVDALMTPDAAQAELTAALTAGSIHANGLNTQSGTRFGIPAMAWIDLELVDDRNAVVARPSGGAGTYERLRLERDEVLRVWPQLGSSRESPLGEAGLGRYKKAAIEEHQAASLARASAAYDALSEKTDWKIVGAKDRNRRINAWLAENNQRPVSARTINRMLSHR